MQKYHGIFALGASAPLALYDIYWLEKACKLQVELLKVG